MPRSSVPRPGPPRRLARAAYLLYGPHHIESTARLIGVDRRTVYRWRNGLSPVPDYVEKAMVVALLKRWKDIEEFLK
jgi:hypothetical protein